MIDGRRFWKMSGSGNDFVFIDSRLEDAAEFEDAKVIQRICARGIGVGADGLVILSAPASHDADVALKYYNADGSLADLCGNATLCTASLSARLGAVDLVGFSIETGAGVLRARIRSGQPEFDLPEINEAFPEFDSIERAAGEERLGFVTAGIPHVVIRVADVDRVDLGGRGRVVRFDGALRNGANANFVSRDGSGRWRMRTYERGVEAETLACGTGSVATALMLRLWGEAGDDIELETASGRTLGIRTSRSGGGGRGDGDGDGASGSWHASLRGEGRLVYEGVMGML
ncbi:MAG: diaminopimelate epimerase [Gemmatimonadaceae bacterium]